MSLEHEPTDVPTHGGEAITSGDARAEARQLAADLDSAELAQAYDLLMAAEGSGGAALDSLDAAIAILATGEELKSKMESSDQADAMKIRVDRILSAAMQERSTRQLEASVAGDMRTAVSGSGAPSTSAERVSAARAAIASAVATRGETAQVDMAPADARLFALLDKGFKPSAGQDVATFLQGFDPEVAAAAKSWVETTAAKNLANTTPDQAGAATVFDALGNNGEYAAQILAFATGTLLPKEQIDRMSFQEYAARLSAAMPAGEAPSPEANQPLHVVEAVASPEEPEATLPEAA